MIEVRLIFCVVVALVALHRVVCENEAPVRIMFLITSSIANIERRQACRLTWLTWIHQQPNLGYVFYVEKPINSEEESATNFEANFFKDVMVGDIARPRQNTLEECSTRRWDVLQSSYSLFGEKYQYYVVVDDDSFVCIPHLLHDAKYWPADRRMHLAHFRRSFPDVISIYGSPLVKEALNLIATSPAEDSARYLRQPLQVMLESNLVKDIAVLNDVRLMYGAQGRNNNRYNDWKNGWVGVHLLSGKEKSSFCDVALSAHQVYPLIMMDLWSYVSRNTDQHNYTVPVLSNNIVDLDTTH